MIQLLHNLHLALDHLHRFRIRCEPLRNPHQLLSSSTSRKNTHSLLNDLDRHHLARVLLNPLANGRERSLANLLTNVVLLVNPSSARLVDSPGMVRDGRAGRGTLEDVAEVVGEGRGCRAEDDLVARFEEGDFAFADLRRNQSAMLSGRRLDLRALHSDPLKRRLLRASTSCPGEPLGPVQASHHRRPP